MRVANLTTLVADVKLLRQQLEQGFSAETAAPGYDNKGTFTAGQCAAAAIIVYKAIGGEFVSSSAPGISHWFNRIVVNGEAFDVDLTGDQFDRPPVQVEKAGSLYPGTRVRAFDEIDHETLNRGRRLAAGVGTLLICTEN